MIHYRHNSFSYFKSGKFALNIPCSLKTAGDWHHTSFPVAKATLYDTNNNIYNDYGIEKHVINGIEYNVANHIRAILDLILNNEFGYLKGFKDDFLVVDDYNTTLFELVYRLKNSKYWDEINKLMKDEFMLEWIDFISKK